MHPLSSFKHQALVHACLLAGVLMVGGSAVVAVELSAIAPKYLAAALGGVGLVTGLVLSGNPRLFLFYLLIFLAPWNIKKDFMYLAHMGGAVSFDFYTADLPLLAIFLYQMRDSLTRLAGRYRFPRELWPWLALMALGLFDVATENYKTPVAHEIYRMARLLLLMLVVVNEVRTRRMFLHLATALLLTGVVQAGIAGLQVVAGSAIGLSSYGEMTESATEVLGVATLQGERGVRRVGGVIGHPNLLGAYLALLTAVGLGLLFAPIRFYLKPLLLGTLGLFGVIIVLTLSRGAWVDVALIISGVVTLTYVHRAARARYFLVRLGIIICVGLLLFAFSGKIVSRMLRSDPNALSSRWEFMATAMDMIKARPVFGFGLNNYALDQLPYTKYGDATAMIDAHGDVGNWPIVHNTWLVVWAEQGTVGFILWCWLHVKVIGAGWRNLRLRDPTLHALGVGLLCGFVAIMFDGLVSFFARMHTAVVLWTIAAAILALDQWRVSTEGSRPVTTAGGVRRAIIDAVPLGRWLPARRVDGLGRGERGAAAAGPHSAPGEPPP